MEIYLLNENLKKYEIKLYGKCSENRDNINKDNINRKYTESI